MYFFSPASGFSTCYSDDGQQSLDRERANLALDYFRQ